MLSTENYLLHKPEGDEKVDINLINENMDTIDRNLKNISDNINQTQGDNSFILIDQEKLTFDTNNICTLNDNRIKSNSIADVYFTSDTVSFADKANISVESYDGKLELTAENTPEGTIKATIKVSIIHIISEPFMINGDIKPYKVAESNSINSGDFVELLTIENNEKTLPDGIGLKNIINVNENLYVGIKNDDNHIVLFQYVNKTIDIVYTHNTDSCKIIKLNDDGLFLNYGMDDYGFLFTVNTEAHTFEIKESLFNQKDPNEFYEIYKISDNKVVAIRNYSNIGGREAWIDFNFYDIFLNEDPELPYEYSYTGSKKKYNFEEMYWCTNYFVGFYENKFYFLSQQKTENTEEYSYYVQLIEFVFNENVTTFTKNVIKTYGNPLRNNSTYHFRNNNKNIIFFEDNTNKISSFAIQKYQENGTTLIEIKTYFYNLKTKELINVRTIKSDGTTIENDGVTSWNNGNCINILGNLWAILCSNSYNLIKYDTVENKIEYYSKSKTLNTHTYITTNPAFFKNRNYIVFIWNGKYITYLFDEVTNEFIIQNTAENFVKEYLDGSNPIGIAKDDGESGELINVYVPAKNILSAEEESAAI